MSTNSRSVKETAPDGAMLASPIDDGREEIMSEMMAEPLDRVLHGLMEAALAARNHLRASQETLCDMEQKLRLVSGDERTGLERKREAALEAYRSARMAAARARMKLLSTLRLTSARPQSVS